MAFTYGFYNYDASDDQADQKIYDADAMSRLFDGLIEDGVYAHVGNCFGVKAASSANKVIIKSGRAWFNHTWCYNDGELALDIPEPHTAYNRIDAIVIDVDNANRHNEITCVQGTASSNPQRPELISTDTRHQYAIAYVTRIAATALVTDENIDYVVGSSSTPYVTGILEHISVEEQVTQFESDLTAWMTAKKAEFDIWFDNVKGQLSEDAAGNLQNEIDSITVERSGTASGTSVSSQYIKVNNVNRAVIYGTSYMEKSHSTSSSSETTCEFTNSAITTGTGVSVMCTNSNVYYSRITVTNGKVQVVFPKSQASSFTVRIILY